MLNTLYTNKHAQNIQYNLSWFIFLNYSIQWFYQVEEQDLQDRLVRFHGDTGEIQQPPEHSQSFSQVGNSCPLSERMFLCQACFQCSPKVYTLIFMPTLNEIIVLKSKFKTWFFNCVFRGFFSSQSRVFNNNTDRATERWIYFLMIIQSRHCIWR